MNQPEVLLNLLRDFLFVVTKICSYKYFLYKHWGAARRFCFDKFCRRGIEIFKNHCRKKKHIGKQRKHISWCRSKFLFPVINVKAVKTYFQRKIFFSYYHKANMFESLCSRGRLERSFLPSPFRFEFTAAVGKKCITRNKNFKQRLLLFRCWSNVSPIFHFFYSRIQRLQWVLPPKGMNFDLIFY